MENHTRPLAVITGASIGIGLEFAKLCGAEGYDLLLIAEDQGVHTAAEALGGAASGVQAVQADLSTYAGNEDAAAAIAARPVDILALNAGFGNAGPFLETSLERDLALIQLNISSVVHLAKRALPAMAAAGAGRVLMTASIAGTMPGPYYATYAASKAFVISFAEALRFELKDSGVTVTALLPGPTDTAFFDRAGMQDTPVYDGKMDDPADVARDAYQALIGGDDKVVAGSVKNTLQAVAAKVLPDPVKARLHAGMTKPEDVAD